MVDEKKGKHKCSRCGYKTEGVTLETQITTGGKISITDWLCPWCVEVLTMRGRLLPREMAGAK